MDSKLRKSKKRPTISYYSVPAIRRSKNECKITTDQGELWDNNNNKNCINKNTVQRQSNIESNPQPMKEAIPSTTFQTPLDLHPMKEAIPSTTFQTPLDLHPMKEAIPSTTFQTPLDIHPMKETIPSITFQTPLDLHPMKETIPSTTFQIPLDLNRFQTRNDTEQNHNNVLKYNSDEERSRGHKQIRVDLSTLKNVVHTHLGIEVLSHRVKRQIRMNRFLSWHRPSELKVLEKAYKNKECTKEDYLKILQIILKDVCIGRDTNISAEFCSCLLEKDDHKEKGDRMCIQTFLIGLEDLIMDYSNPCINKDMWKKFILFLAELFFFTEINIFSLCLLPLISNALNVTRYFIQN